MGTSSGKYAYKLGDIVYCGSEIIPCREGKIVGRIVKVDGFSQRRDPYVLSYYVTIIGGPERVLGRRFYVTESDLHKLSDEELTLILLEN